MATVEELMSLFGVSWFKFDEASGNALDSKGSVVGTVNGATRTVGYKNEGTALSLNDNSVDFNSPIINTSEFTIRLKVRFNTLYTSGAKNRIINTLTISPINGFSLDVSDELNFRIEFCNNGVVGNAKGGKAEVGKWYDVVCGIKDNVGFLFVDGKKIGNAYLSTPFIIGTNMMIGKIFNINTGHFDIDNLEIYAKDITEPKTIIKNDTSHYSLNNQTLINLPSSSSKNMILHGLEAGKEVRLDVDFDKMKFIDDTSEVLGVGKTYTHSIDTSQVKVNKLIL